MTPEVFVLGAQGRAELATRTAGGRWERQSDLDGMQLKVNEVTGLDESEAASLFEELGLELPPCDGKSCEWTRVDGLLPLPASPFDAPPPTPREVLVIVGLNVADVKQLLEPQVSCEVQAPQKVVGERRYDHPTVTFLPFMVDSAEFQSELVDGVGLLRQSASPAFSRSHVQTSANVESVTITLNERCAGYEAPDPRPATPCWTERVALPPLGSITLDDGFSGTVVPRAPLLDVFSTGDVQSLGSRRTAVQGAFDRGAIQVFTEVPYAYRAAGITTALYDFRAQRFFDWEHAGAFTVPSPQADHTGRVPRYATKNAPYFANWKTEKLKLKYRHDAPRSFCTLPQDVFVTPLSFKFEGAGLASPKTVPATNVLTSGTRDTMLRFQVAPGRDAHGDTHLVP